MKEFLLGMSLHRFRPHPFPRHHLDHQSRQSHQSRPPCHPPCRHHLRYPQCWPGHLLLQIGFQSERCSIQMKEFLLGMS